MPPTITVHRYVTTAFDARPRKHPTQSSNARKGVRNVACGQKVTTATRPLAASAVRRSAANTGAVREDALVRYQSAHRKPARKYWAKLSNVRRSRGSSGTSTQYC